jgi:hypothetical protein
MNTRFLLFAVMLSFFSCFGLFAQDFTDAELKLFGQTYERVRLNKGDNYDLLTEAVNKSGLSQTRFEEIWAADMMKKPLELTEAEKIAFEKIRVFIRDEQAKRQKNAERIITEAGFSLERYNELMSLYREDSRFQNRIYRLMQEK